MHLIFTLCLVADQHFGIIPRGGQTVSKKGKMSIPLKENLQILGHCGHVHTLQ